MGMGGWDLRLGNWELVAGPLADILEAGLQWWGLVPGPQVYCADAEAYK